MSGKIAAARKAAEIVLERIEPGMDIGVGTGSTVKETLRILASMPDAREKLSRVRLYASSIDTALYLEKMGLHVSTILPSKPLDMYFDGADEVTVENNTCYVVKGRGAAMTREKIFAYNSKLNILVVDETKLSPRLGSKGKPVPVEVIAVAINSVKQFLEQRGIRVSERDCNCRDGPAVTDNYGLVLDTWPWGVVGPLEYEELLDRLPGVIGHGLFIGYFNLLVVGGSDGAARIVECRRSRGVLVDNTYREG